VQSVDFVTIAIIAVSVLAIAGGMYVSYRK